MNKNIIMNLSFNKTVLFVKIFEILAVFATLGFLLYGCSSDNIADEGQDTPDSNVTMNLRAGADPAFMNNASIYVFTSDNKFIEKKRNVNVDINDNTFSTYISAGTWNLVLLTCKTSLQGKITMPLYGATAATSPMWETKLIAPDFLDQTPADLSYAALPGTVITPYMKTEKDANLTRNVAKIQVILKEHIGFSEIEQGRNDYAFVDLLEVPTTLNWKGEYFPNKTNPDYWIDKPIREFFNFNSQLEADTINFIVPAHRGTDAFEPVHNDTTTHKLKFRISLPLNDQSYFGKSQIPIEISYVPKINKIIQLLVTFRGEPDTYLNVKVTVKDWIKDWEDVPEEEVEFN